MLCLESVMTTAASIIGGILAGILLGKLVYLILLKILHMGGKIEYRVSLASAGMTMILFGVIFILIFLYNLLQMKLSNPIELLRGGNTGEREPKTKWIMTIIGIFLSGRWILYCTYHKRTDGGIRKVLCRSYSCYCRNLFPVYGRKYCIFENSSKQKKLLL